MSAQTSAATGDRNHARTTSAPTDSRDPIYAYGDFR
jgi:hypothetical protein